MYIIAGLGNPGRAYEATRHNMGFDTVDELIDRERIPSGGVKFNALYGKGVIAGQKVLLMKPLSYMNLSGGPIRQMVDYFHVDPHFGGDEALAELSEELHKNDMKLILDISVNHTGSEHDGGDDDDI